MRPVVSAPVVAVPFDYPPRTTIGAHSHPVHQLVYAARGVMRVRTARGDWVVPPNRALWMPRDTEHEIRTVGSVAMRTLYIEPARIEGLPAGCAVVAVPPLLRELILRLVQIDAGERADGREFVVGLIAHELRLLESQPLHVALPDDERLRSICEAIEADPGSELTCAGWAALYGLSEKTLARDFRRNLGMTFGQWRQHVRLLAALERLACDEPVATIALDLGYRNPSAFSAMFRRALGSTPSAYFA
jgi:AraC-like DNA-binding protein